MIGTQISHYRITAKLGEGGMGEVFRAEDTRLGRPVALKVLTLHNTPGAPKEETWEAALRGGWEGPDSATGTSSVSPRQRFLKEARAASALNHPGIVAIYDIGESEGRLYIAMELVEGETLRGRIKQGPLDFKTLLRMAIQMTDTLDRAHGAGIVHRDIKPENIMLTPDGFTKLLDFGVAKLRRAQGQGAETMDGSQTQPGTVLGTVSYMSPEQTAGEDLDHRSDLFSFGAVLYECVAGRQPFQGTVVEIMYAIAHTPAEDLRQIQPQAPEELVRIIEKLMELDKEDRYQNARDLAVDLRRLERRGVAQVREVTLVDAAPLPSARPSPIPHSPYPIRRTALSVAAGVILGGFAVFFWLTARTAAPATTSQVFPVTHLRRQIEHLALSPDGRMIAFIAGDSQVYVALTASGEPTQITHTPEAKQNPRFSSDGTRILFAALTADQQSDLWEVPALGGNARRVLSDAIGGAWSPDGSRLAFVRARPGAATIQSKELYVGDAYGNNPRRLYEGAGNPILYLAWTPDNRRIVFLEGYRAWFPPRLMVVPADGSSPSRVLVEGNLTVGRVAVSPDGRWAYYSAVKDGLVNLWRVPADGGVPQQVTFSAGQDHSPVAGADGQLYFLNSRYRSAIHLANESGTRQVLEETLVGNARISPDGNRIVYVRRPHSGTDLGDAFVVSADGSNPQRVSAHGNVIGAVWSRDGRQIALNRWSFEPAEVLDAETGRQVLTIGKEGYSTAVLDFGPGGQLLIARSARGQGYSPDTAIYDPATRQERSVAKNLQAFGWSADGQWIGLTSRSPAAVLLVPAAGGEPRKVYDGPAALVAFHSSRPEILIATSLMPPQFVTVPINGGKGGPGKPWSSAVMLEAITRFGPQALKAFDPSSQRALMVVSETDTDVYRMRVEK